MNETDKIYLAYMIGFLMSDITMGQENVKKVMVSLTDYFKIDMDEFTRFLTDIRTKGQAITNELMSKSKGGVNQ